MPVQSQMSSPGSQGTWGSPAPGDHLPSLQSPCSPLSGSNEAGYGGEGEPILLLSWDQAGDGARARLLAEGV